VNRKALLIGCGNIGAQYDLHDATKVWTHAKAFSLQPQVEWTVTDKEADKAQEIAGIYQVPFIESRDEMNLSIYDLVSLTTPTTTHASILKQAFRQNVPVVICEKPVIATIAEKEELEELYRSSKTKVLINYMRRFHPDYHDLKEWMTLQQVRSGLRNIIIKYKRGFLNNASHAIDLLEFLFDEPFLATEFQVQQASFDVFAYDPTLTATCTFLQQPVLFCGVTDVPYAVFELELYFSSCKIVICHSGDEVRIYKPRDKSVLVEDNTLRKTGILKEYMLPVIQKALRLLDGEGEDNFLSSLSMNWRILNLLEPIKERVCHLY
jgi:predicted dehydrogenase